MPCSARLIRLTGRLLAVVGMMTVQTAAAGVTVASATEGSEPWLAAAFSVSASDIAQAAAELAASDADVELLLRDDRFSFDSAGLMTHTRHWVYRILTTEGLETWSVSEAAWSPWYQSRPDLRARVVTPSGDERGLSAASVIELDAEQSGLGGERRLIRGPLPVTVGAIVEEEVISRDHRPYFEAGISAKHLLVMQVPIRRGRLTLEAPTRLPLRFGVRGVEGLEPQREVIGDQVRLVFNYADVPAAGPAEAGLPSTEPRYPHIVFSTGEGWAEVAGAYARLVDERVATGASDAVLRQLPNRGVGAQMERVAELLSGLRQMVDYHPVEFGLSGVDPGEPLATLRRGFGDSKDLATAMVAALRAEGIPAYVALLRAGYGMDLEPDLPGLGRFNHALVYLPASEPIWLDPGDRYSRAGELASDRQDRWALVASPNTHHLIRTSAASSADNRTETIIEVFMAEEGPARVVETSTHFGASERRQRLVTTRVDSSERRLGYEAYVQAAYRAETLGAVEETTLDDLSKPFRLRLEARRAGRAWTTEREAAVAIDLSYLITTLPRELLVSGAGSRRGGFVFHEPLSAVWRYRIHPPRGMRLRAVPAARTWPLGSGQLTRSIGFNGSVVTTEVRLDTGPRHLDAEQFRAYYQAVQQLLQEEVLVLWFDRVKEPRRRADPSSR